LIFLQCANPTKATPTEVHTGSGVSENALVNKIKANPVMTRAIGMQERCLRRYEGINDSDAKMALNTSNADSSAGSRNNRAPAVVEVVSNRAGTRQ